MKTIFISCAISILLITSYSEVFACPKCNDDFRKELLNERANTLGAQELLKSIENQSGNNQLISTPVKYMTNDTLGKEDSKQEIIEDKTDNFSLNALAIIMLLSPLGFIGISLIL